MRLLLLLRMLVWVVLMGTTTTATAGSLGAPPAPKGRVVVFLNTECPISQQYTRLLVTLAKTYGPQGILFEALYPSPTDRPRTIQAFQRTYRLPFMGKPDGGHRQVRRYRARTTPEVFVLNGTGQIIYSGAIDDGYVALGRRRPEPTQHYLRDALTALLEGRPIMLTRTEAVGCLIE
jgi:hypothetical protein